MDSMQESATLKAALNILRTSPASDTEKNLSCLQELLSPNPDALAELTQHVHLPLQTAMDGDKAYIYCSWNRLPDDTFRSPYKDENNKLQAHANELWATYKQMYYGNGAVGSVYVVSNKNVTNMCFLLQNKQLDVGEWNSVHIVHVTPNATTKSTTFTIQSTVLVMIGFSEISAHVSKYTSTSTNTITSPNQYMETIGPMLESIETELRSSLENVQLPKARDIVTQVRRKNVPKLKTPGMSHTDMLNQAVLARAAMQTKKG